MKSTKFIVICGSFCAVMIAVQLVLSAVAGVELVTPIFFAFCFVLGLKYGVAVASVFSVLRCLFFGFSPNVIVLYLVYYNCFALVVGGIGKLFSHCYSIKSHVVATVLAPIITAVFTLLDDIITPIMLGFNLLSAKAYFLSSLPIITTQMLCSLITVAVLFAPLVKALKLAIRNK